MQMQFVDVYGRLVNAEEVGEKTVYSVSGTCSFQLSYPGTLESTPSQAMCTLEAMAPEQQEQQGV